MPVPRLRLDPIRCVLGDLTRAEVDAIVNAANTELRGGGGVDGAIHAAAGPELLAECIERYPDGCPTGEARLTHGYRLPARFVIHTPGPRWAGGDRGEPARLAASYANSVGLAAAEGIRTLAFPAISCGIYGYPHAAAAAVAVRALGEALARHPGIVAVQLVFREPALLEVFVGELERLRRASSAESLRKGQE